MLFFKSSGLAIVAAAVLLVSACGGGGGSSAGGSSNPTPTPAPTPIPAPVPVPETSGYFVSTFAGVDEPSAPRDLTLPTPIDGVGTAARFRSPFQMTMDGAGNIYVTEDVLRPIRKITPDGVVTTLASGPVGDSGISDGPIAADPVGNLYFYAHHGISKMSTAGVVSRVAETYMPDFMAADAAGNVYMTQAYSIDKLSPSGVLSTLPGSDQIGRDESAILSPLYYSLGGIAVDAVGNVFVSDIFLNAVRKISPQGQVTTLAKGGFTAPRALALDGAGNVYVNADALQVGGYRPYAGAVVKISSTGEVTTLAGGPEQHYGYVNGPASVAMFGLLTGGIVADKAGNVFVMDVDNASIRKIARQSAH